MSQLDRSGQLSGGGSNSKPRYGSAVTRLGTEDVEYGVKIVKKAVVLAAVVAVLMVVFVGFGWNYVWRKRAILGFVRNFPDTELRGAVDGQFVKVTGVRKVSPFFRFSLLGFPCDIEFWALLLVHFPRRGVVFGFIE